MPHKKTFVAAIYFFPLLCISFTAKSQNNSLGSWNTVNVEYYLINKLSLWGEVQVRSQELTDEFYYHQLKGGINYKPNKNFALLLGTGQYATYSNGGNFKSPVLNHELKLWEQITLVNNIDRLKIEHRYRIEQRWRGGEYRNRFRYRINVIIPLNKRTVEKGALYASIYDEIFLTNRPQYFEQNRFYAGLSYQFSKPFKLQIGWLRQFDYAGNDMSSNKDFLQTALFFGINKHKSGHEIPPSSMD